MEGLWLASQCRLLIGRVTAEFDAAPWSLLQNRTIVGPRELRRKTTMSSPRTTLDARFSDPGSRATGWDQAREVLEAAELFWISTVRADGRPHVTPLVAVWTEDRLHFCTGPDEHKALNLQRNPYVVLTTGRNTWDDGLDVMVEGKAVQVTDEARSVASLRPG